MSNPKYKVFNDSGLQALVSQTKANKKAAEENSSAVDGLTSDFQEMSNQVATVLGDVESCLTELDTVKADTATVSEGLSKKADKDHAHDNYASTVTTTGSGNAITAISQSGNTITATKGSTFSLSGHTHSEYVNQNAFGKVKVGNTEIAADAAVDTLTLVAGSNVTITPDATNDKVTIAATDTVYTHPTSHPASMITGLSEVATSGQYSDLSGKPTIPTTLPNPKALTFTGAVNATYDGSSAVSVEIPEALIGSTAEITPTQVANAIAEGRPVLIGHLDSTFGLLACNYFTISESLDALSTSAVVKMPDNSWYAVEVVGHTSNNTWVLLSTAIAEKTGIPTKLPNPNAITFTGAVTGTYDGSSAKTVNIPVAPVSSVNGKTGAVSLSASDVGADASGAANTALANANSYTDTKISALINSAPTTLDTLGEIATAMENNADVVEALEDAVGTKVDKTTTVNGHALSGNVTVTKSDVGLGNVENKSSATIRGELTKANVTTALGYTPPTADNNTTYSISKSGSTITLTGSDGTTSTVTDSNTTYSNATLGQGYGTCATAASTAAKVVTLSSYSLETGGVVSVKFTNAVPANATMNINSKGAKNIYYRGAKITAGIIEDGDIATFIYDGTQYHLLTVDRHRFFSLLLPYGVSIEASESSTTDINTVQYLKVGNYYCSSNAKAKYVSNLPKTGTAFMMTVSSPLSTAIDNETTGTWVYRLRRLQYYTGDEYVQYCYAGATAGTWTYGPWKKVEYSTDSIDCGTF